MRISRTVLVWAAFAFCAALILAAMAWQTRNALAAERERAAAERKAELQEKMRLSLWRMDSLGAALLIEESAGGMPDFIRGRFVWRQDGSLSLPDGGSAPPELRKIIPASPAAFDGCAVMISSPVGEAWKAQAPAPPPEDASAIPRKGEKAQETASNTELQKRSQSLDNVISKNRELMEAEAPPAARLEKKSPPAKKPAAAPAELPEVALKDIPAGAPADAFAPGRSAPPASPMPSPAPAELRVVNAPAKALWLGDGLFLFRNVTGPGRSLAGAWLDLPLLRARLLAEVRDLLPSASLVPATGPSADGLVLASLPLRLDPGKAPAFQPLPAAPVILSLSVGWTAVILAILAASLLVGGVMRLSERRASFVSAVTHELRTPLTTFRLYSDMLESGAVREEKRGDYLRVLSREADRLAHLVENVLAFSRIERGSARSAVATTRPADLLEPMRERFATRLSSAGLSLEMDLTTPLAGQRMKVDAAAVEHILFNLVDNAAKYACSATPPQVEIALGKGPRFLEIRVTDHGPGIPAAERRRIFRAFHKSAREAAETRPGVGLGLALSRRLARGLGGDLTVVPGTDGGAVFTLSLPLSGAD